MPPPAFQEWHLPTETRRRVREQRDARGSGRRRAFRGDAERYSVQPREIFPPILASSLKASAFRASRHLRSRDEARDLADAGLARRRLGFPGRSESNPRDNFAENAVLLPPRTQMWPAFLHATA